MGGLQRRGQWWFPMVLGLVVSLAGFTLLYDRAIIPMQRAQLERQVQEQGAPPEMLERFDRSTQNVGIRAFSIGIGACVYVVFTLLLALLPWIAAGFVLGHRFTYRDAFVVTAWAGLVHIPAQVIAYALGWVNRTLQGQHLSLAVLLPTPDTPSKLLSGVAFFLDYGLGPFWLWWLAVMVLGTSALSGAPRRSVAWTMGGIWLAVILVIATVKAIFVPAA